MQISTDVIGFINTCFYLYYEAEILSYLLNPFSQGGGGGPGDKIELNRSRSIFSLVAVELKVDGKYICISKKLSRS